MPAHATRGLPALLAGGLLAVSLAASGQSVTLQGVLGTKALIVVEGGSPRLVAPGDSYLGVKVISASGDVAVLEVQGKRQSLRVGDAPMSSTMAKPQVGAKVVMSADSGGHFFSQGQINGRAVNFVVDTGATLISMGASDAKRIGIDFMKTGTPGRSSTANGVVEVWRVKLDAVRVGDVEIYNVDAVVSPATMPYILLGNSFLSRFQLTQANGQMVLERRY